MLVRYELKVTLGRLFKKNAKTHILYGILTFNKYVTIAFYEKPFIISGILTVRSLL